jgi:hypothetical protein
MVVSGYFYPIEGVLGYSDADFLFALPYSGYDILDWIFLHLTK